MISTNPLVSILIPNYNKAPYVRDTLDSVLNQTYQNWECIVVDDHSTDDSWEILEEFAAKDKRFKIYKRPDDLPKGGNVCRNYAFKLSKGEYINWFDSDDLMKEELVENRVKVIENFNLEFTVFGGVIFNADVIRQIGINEPIIGLNSFVKYFILLNPPWCTLSCMYRRKFLESKNLKWDDSLLGLQDVDFSLSCYMVSSRIGISVNYYDFYWREYEDKNRAGRNHTSFVKLKTLTRILKKFNSIRLKLNCNKIHEAFKLVFHELLYLTMKRFSFYWFRVYIFPLFMEGLFSLKETIYIFNEIIIFYIFRFFGAKYNFRKTLKSFEYEDINLLKVERIPFPVQQDHLEPYFKRLTGVKWVDFNSIKLTVHEK
ncbi:glycosyltransferase family 2 protein [Echinicola sp. CAU 1574]|uniref:Glycosyltransferase family 2 protein n=1 Tax=Echinicola arenosa TaxID=2774144 RepID=A0ABR9ANQ5_9BACT|nr:glycosyltransferase family 2 protein [Echinicola arenosa]MBD8490437.1 glycosyltransferase family 2 protein [Echinicola arenosa]